VIAPAVVTTYPTAIAQGSTGRDEARLAPQVCAQDASRYDTARRCSFSAKYPPRNVERARQLAVRTPREVLFAAGSWMHGFYDHGLAHVFSYNICLFFRRGGSPASGCRAARSLTEA